MNIYKKIFLILASGAFIYHFVHKPVVQDEEITDDIFQTAYLDCWN